MSNAKYTIINCPACNVVYCTKNNNWFDKLHLKKCQNCTNCFLKQIVEMCENALIKNPNQDDENFNFDIGRDSLAEEILQMFEIEGKENE